MQLSIIVPVYNCEEYLNKCIDSILNQTYKDFELILVDDGSTDDSGRIIDQYGQLYPNIVSLHKENGGPTTARREGIKKAKGEYILFADGDDWLDETMCGEMLEAAKLHNSDIVMCDMLKEAVNSRYNLINLIDEGAYDKALMKEKLYPAMLFSCETNAPAIIPSLCNKIIKRSIIEKILNNVNDTIAFGEDALCSYPALLDAEIVCVIRKPFYHYRYNGASVTNSYDKMLTSKILLLHDELKQQFDARGFDLTDQLSGYIAKCALDGIRKEMLFNTKLPLKQRINAVKKYVNDPRIHNAIKNSEDKIVDKKTKKKFKLISTEKLYLLYMLFRGKEIILKIKGFRK